MTTFHHIEFELTEAVGTVWLNRPDKHNALNAEMIGEITEVFTQINQREDIRVVVLRGRGKSFCAGADLNYMKGIAEFGYEENYQDSLCLARCFHSIYTCKKPTLAIVQGAAIGGANGLLAACDFVYCADETKFAFSEVKLGIVPATIAPYVIKRIGEHAARDLMLTGRSFSGMDAEEYKLVNKSLEADEMEDYASHTIKLLMSSAPEAVTACKGLIEQITNKIGFEDAIDYTAKLIATLRASNEGQEGMAAFLEKRKPKWVEKK